ncbi:MAG: DUF4433 domain-containing protein [Rhodococcus sp. (in: high G+C Gram-positive bacteria)]|uniref:type II toxin-antitoxin system toxin DNA ADP-ribosyl transferase DarT n=1 Tax=Rhodococcus sp. TaxID=1831 RepID=UPI003BB78F83
MPRPKPTYIAHFTHIDNLAAITRHGLFSDTRTRAESVPFSEAGEPAIKSRRREQRVKADPGGVVADYVPFYYAPRSPMMYRLHRGGVPTFTGNTHDLVYLVTSIEHLIYHGHRLVFTDRNAAAKFAVHSNRVTDLDDLVDWDLMTADDWSNTDDDPDRKSRRMAECLAYEGVIWDAITQVTAFDEQRASRVEAILSSALNTPTTLGAEAPAVRVNPRAYF